MQCYSQEELKSWIQTCLKKPLLKRLEISLDPAPVEVVLLSLVTFFLTPCSHLQTLVLSDISSHESVPTGLYHQNNITFDEAYTSRSCTLPSNKSLVIKNCYFMPSFSIAVSGLKPLKLKELVISKSIVNLSPFVQHPFTDVESLEIVKHSPLTNADYVALFQKNSLKKVRLDVCMDNRGAVCEAAEQGGFHTFASGTVYEFTKYS